MSHTALVSGGGAGGELGCSSRPHPPHAPLLLCSSKPLSSASRTRTHRLRRWTRSCRRCATGTSCCTSRITRPSLCSSPRICARCSTRASPRPRPRRRMHRHRRRLLPPPPLLRLLPLLLARRRRRPRARRIWRRACVLRPLRCSCACRSATHSGHTPTVSRRRPRACLRRTARRTACRRAASSRRCTASSRTGSRPLRPLSSRRSPRPSPTARLRSRSCSTAAPRTQLRWACGQACWGRAGRRHPQACRSLTWPPHCSQRSRQGASGQAQRQRRRHLRPQLPQRGAAAAAAVACYQLQLSKAVHPPPLPRPRRPRPFSRCCGPLPRARSGPCCPPQRPSASWWRRSLWWWQSCRPTHTPPRCSRASTP